MDLPLIGPILRWLQATFFSKQLQIVILGLQSAGKTSLVNVISSGQFAEEMVPTVGFNVRVARPRDGRFLEVMLTSSGLFIDEKSAKGQRAD